MRRREFVEFAAAGSGVLARGVGAAQIGSSAAGSALKLPSRQQPAKPEEIVLKDGLLRTRYELHRRRLKGIPPEDILMPFLRARGLPTSGKELNADCLNHCQTGPGNWPGLQSTYWFSGAAATARWGRDEELRRTLLGMVHDLAQAREPDGFLLASPTGYQRWDNHYSLTSRARSMIRGLVDIYEATRDPLALELARGQADSLWKEVQSRPVPGGTAYVRAGGSVDTRLTPLGQRLTYLDFISATFKLPPALALLYLHTGEPRYAELARMCIDPVFIDRLTGSNTTDDPLAGRHAYLTMDLLYGAHILGQLTENQKYTTAAVHAWKLIADRHLFATGGMGSREAWAPGAQGWQLPETLNAQETCAAAHWIVYNSVLLEWSGEAKYAEHIERTLYNDLLAAQNPETGDVTYFLNLAGKDKLFDPPPRFGRHCCEGNHMFSLGSMPGLIYGRSGDTLAINLYVPSELSTQLASGQRVTLVQETRYPADGEVLIRVTCQSPARFGLKLRIPSWCPAPPRLEINGAEAAVEAQPGEWQLLDREWKNGDHLGLALPMGPYLLQNMLSTVPRLALRWGPLILAGTWEDDLPLAQDPAMPEFQLRSRINRLPYVPALAVQGSDAAALFRRLPGAGPSFEARAIPSAVIPAAPLSGARVKQPRAARISVRFAPFYELTRGKYSIWFPAILEA